VAGIILDIDDYKGEVGGESVHELTRGLDVRFDEVSASGDRVEFTGPREDLITLVTRFTDDPATHAALVALIR